MTRADIAPRAAGGQDVPAPYRHGERIEQLIGGHAAHTPDATAVEQDGATMTYGQLWAGSGRLAAGLAAHGVGDGNVVALLAHRSPELVAAMVGVLRTGAAYVALDPAWPRDRIDDILARSGAVAVRASDVDRPGTLVLDDLRADGAARLPVHRDGTRPASVFYTSGSTGRPKGVLSPHRGALRLLVGNPALPLDRGTVTLQAAPTAWDMHSFELWGALLNGGRCVLLGHGRPTVDVGELRTAFDRGVNTLWLTTSLFNVFADEAPEVLRPARLVAVGGERLSVPHVRRVLDALPGLHLVNGYGPAECSMLASVHRIRSSDVDGGATDVPIGTAVPLTTVTLLGEDGEPVHGEGEIALAGDGVATGYLADPEETAARFVSVDGVRHYRTGDLGRYDDEGLLRYRGRADRQFKINGVRIEPGEVEAAIGEHPDVASCVALRVTTDAGDGRLACVYTTAGGRDVPLAELRTHATRTLITAMVPAVLLRVPALPLLPNGKLDHLRVTELVAARPAPVGESGSDDADPLLRMVRDLLPGATETTDLIGAGLTSLDAVRLATRLGDRAGIRCSIGDLYRLRTVARLRAATNGATVPVPAGDPPAAPVDATEGPLATAQQRFWWAEQLAPGAADNTLILAYELAGPIEPGALAAALADVVADHGVLRTVYPLGRDELPAQHVLDAAAVDVRLERADAEPAGPEGIQALAERLTADWWHLMVDLECEPPLRARLYRLDADRHLLCVRVHHIAFDGWSEHLFVSSLSARYRERTGQAAAVRTPERHSYLGHSSAERSRLGTTLPRNLPYWRDALDRPAPPWLPEPTEIGEAPRREVALRVEPEIVDGLRQAAVRHGGPPLAVLLAAAASALAAVFDAPDMLLGTVDNGRWEPETEEVIGYFVNALVIPMSDVDGRAPVLDQAVSRLLEALDHSVPFDELVRVLAPPRDRHPWFQTFVVLQLDRPAESLDDRVRLAPVRVRQPTTSIELMIEAMPQPDGSWHLVIMWRTDGIGDETAQRLRGALDVALRELSGSRPHARQASSGSDE
jgi:amino acid adenylation domain-containing protein